MYVINGTTLEIVSFRSPNAPVKVRAVDLAAYGAGITSVAAIALGGRHSAASDKTSPGTLVLMRRDGRVVASTAVGSLPDMVTFDVTDCDYWSPTRASRTRTDSRTRSTRRAA